MQSLAYDRSIRLICTDLSKELTNYESHSDVAPQYSSLNLVLCEVLGLGDVQTMKVDLPPLLTILG